MRVSFENRTPIYRGELDERSDSKKRRERSFELTRFALRNFAAMADPCLTLTLALFSVPRTCLPVGRAGKQTKVATGILLI